MVTSCRNCEKGVQSVSFKVCGSFLFKPVISCVNHWWYYLYRPLNASFLPHNSIIVFSDFLLKIHLLILLNIAFLLWAHILNGWLFISGNYFHLLIYCVSIDGLDGFLGLLTNRQWKICEKAGRKKKVLGRYSLGLYQVETEGVDFGEWN